MDHRIENFQYGLHSTLWVLSKDVHTPGVTPPRYIQRHTTFPLKDKQRSWRPCVFRSVESWPRGGLAWCVECDVTGRNRAWHPDWSPCSGRNCLVRSGWIQWWQWCGSDYIKSTPPPCSTSFFTRDSICYSAYMQSPVRPSVWLSVCLSQGWISQKRLKLGSRNFHHTVAPSL